MHPRRPRVEPGPDHRLVQLAVDPHGPRDDGHREPTRLGRAVLRNGHRESGQRTVGQRDVEEEVVQEPVPPALAQASHHDL